MLQRLARLPLLTLVVLGALGLVALYWLLIIRSFHALDARVFYSPSAVRELFDSIGPQGRRDYFLQEAFADMAWMAIYTLLLLNVYRWAGGTRPALCLLPVTFDLIETLGILVLLSTYPELGAAETWIVTAASPLKWGSIVLVSLLIFAAWNRGRASADGSPKG